MSLSSGGPCEITVPRACAWLAPRVFIHGRPSTLAPCPSVVQLVFVMPTPRYSRVPYALCPALHPPALYNRYSAGGVCTAGNSHFQTIPYQKGLGGLPTSCARSLLATGGLRPPFPASPFRACRCRAFHHVTGSTVRPHIRACPTLRVASPRQVRPSACPFGRVAFLPATVSCGHALRCEGSSGRDSLCAGIACLDGGEHITRSPPSRKGADGVFYAPPVRLVLAFWLIRFRSRLLHTASVGKGPRAFRQVLSCMQNQNSSMT